MKAAAFLFATCRNRGGGDIDRLGCVEGTDGDGQGTHIVTMVALAKSRGRNGRKRISVVGGGGGGGRWGSRCLFEHFHPLHQRLVLVLPTLYFVLEFLDAGSDFVSGGGCRFSVALSPRCLAPFCQFFLCHFFFRFVSVLVFGVGLDDPGPVGRLPLAVWSGDGEVADGAVVIVVVSAVAAAVGGFGGSRGVLFHVVSGVMSVMLVMLEAAFLAVDKPLLFGCLLVRSEDFLPSFACQGSGI